MNINAVFTRPSDLTQLSIVQMKLIKMRQAETPGEEMRQAETPGEEMRHLV